MAPVTITAITNRIGTTTVKDCLAQPLKFRLASQPEDDMITVPPQNFVVLKPGGDANADMADAADREDGIQVNGMKTNRRLAENQDESGSESGSSFIEPEDVLFPRHSLPIHWTQRYPNTPGFVNNGVTCYMNSVLQVLLHVPAMVDYLLHVHRKDCNESDSCMMCAFAKLADECYVAGGRRKPLYPRFILKKLKVVQPNSKFGDHRQEDAHEFLRQFIDALQLSVAPKHLKEPVKETSVVHRIFGGRFRQQIRCKKCNYPSNTFQPTLDVQLDIRRGGGTVDDALKKFFAAEMLSKAKGNAYKCERCKTHVDALKRTMIYDSPDYVTLHLKRFDFTLRGTSKIHDFIKYPKYLDLTAYSTRGEKLGYELIGVIIHQGRRTSSGHYYAFCKQSDGSWANYNDEIVDRVSEKTAMKQEAYILLYARVAVGAAANGNGTSKAPNGTTQEHKISRKGESENMKGDDDIETDAEEASVKAVPARKRKAEMDESPRRALPMVKLFDDENLGEVISRKEFELGLQNGSGTAGTESGKRLDQEQSSDTSTVDEEITQFKEEQWSALQQRAPHKHRDYNHHRHDHMKEIMLKKQLIAQAHAKRFAKKKSSPLSNPFQPQDYSNRSPVNKGKKNGVHIGPKSKMRHQMNRKH
ncbi:hypothetical protein POJ06DRAFT_133695 [Lipomyces tetrasporus]|uniref:ubiquitinyl hydrolase 1 n=1 Tax=Lipomyces tetrasporus TaxID=54092 RepID=A0AAD7VST4_9ASCO|nr:uncharacterized protein POJ06DRAFT_133695 [Lipomyces tetrasporus]KAJ8099355.1 hypothetical protein POJ06DRAFT_133695 [Lipomyces tetrasporus]